MTDQYEQEALIKGDIVTVVNTSVARGDRGVVLEIINCEPLYPLYRIDLGYCVGVFKPDEINLYHRPSVDSTPYPV